MSVNGGRGGAVTEGEMVCMDGGRGRGELSLTERECVWMEGGGELSLRERWCVWMEGGGEGLSL